ncbi:protein PROTON GRADIENT REGULATION 5, chloroplastic isoform X2 [Andrographis paniculata]|uniref:protein PROTON GRADIENT REGULATION 5, chloroplastic isoform X2 n=1 Tax=Andrographis paniculata TaxID=175694 RepID=UPI0021E8A0E4|nr:protein PROTON GRADIENT REGULATION 5, chloroplastic isoform X2 [Andrographis paniculata]
MAAVASVSASAFLGSRCGEDHGVLQTPPARAVRVARRPVRSLPMMGNINEGKGVFAPLVVITRNIVGKKRFNQIRGKAIALHSQSIGADAKQRQGLIRLAKKNGERLGFLA